MQPRTTNTASGFYPSHREIFQVSLTLQTLMPRITIFVLGVFTSRNYFLKFDLIIVRLCLQSTKMDIIYSHVRTSYLCPMTGLKKNPEQMYSTEMNHFNHLSLIKNLPCLKYQGKCWINLGKL